MAEIIKLIKEDYSEMIFAGIKYTESDRLNNSYSHKWDYWFSNNLFAKLESLKQLDNIDNGYIGLMRYPEFEYWIGMFLPVDSVIPEGFEYIKIPKSSAAVCYIKGLQDDSNIYEKHFEVQELIKSSNIGKVKDNPTINDKWIFFERYNCPRFTTPDKDGFIILDYGTFLE